jgi:hypothetical protein
MFVCWLVIASSPWKEETVLVPFPSFLPSAFGFPKLDQSRNEK